MRELATGNAELNNAHLVRPQGFEPEPTDHETSHHATCYIGEHRGYRYEPNAGRRRMVPHIVVVAC
jgi:hypothetical protein